MKLHVQNTDRGSAATIVTIAVTMLVASLLSSVAITNADAKGNGAKAPAPGAAALTAQEQIGRNQGVRPVERPQKMSLDRECKGPHVPKRCHRHQH